MKNPLLRKSLIILLLLCTGWAMNETVAQPLGSGTLEDPYQIANIENLSWITQNSGSWDKYFIQTANIDASASSGWGDGFTPIGSTTTPFSGTYNGQGSVISGFTINRGSADNVGMFGYVEGGVVKNLGLTDVNITGKDYVGALAGKTSGSSTLIDMCFTSGSVTGNAFVGGLVGFNLMSATIQNCGSRAAITGGKYVGGLAGVNLETINNCYATGLVTATTGGGGLVGGIAAVTNCFWDTETSGLSASIGGTGKTSAEMKEFATFTNTATSGLTTAWDFVGTSNDDAGTNDWWNMNLISAKTDNDGYPVPSWWVVTDEPTGDGFSGTPYQIATLNNLYWLSQGGGTAIWGDNKHFEQTEDIPAKSTAYINSGKGFSPIGGYPDSQFKASYDGQNHAIDYLFINRPDQDYVGLFGSLLSSSIFNLGITNGNVTGHNRIAMLDGGLDQYDVEVQISNCYISGAVRGNSHVGGLMGYVHNGSSAKTNIKDCQSSGSVEGSNNIGGLIGSGGDLSVGDVTVQNSYSTANLTVNQPTEGNAAGGLVGIICTDGEVMVSDCYSSGNITINKIGEFTQLQYAGGLIGMIEETEAGAGSKIENCYSRGNITLNAGSNNGHIGGLIGEIRESACISVNKCYSTGSVPGSGTTGGLIGGLSACSSGDACFWDMETSGTTVGVGNTGDPTWVSGETTAEMKIESTFTNAGWDFTTIWAMDVTTNDGYAYLLMLSVPDVSTAETSNIGANSAQSGGDVIYEGSSAITAKGVVWNTTDNPTISNYLGITNDGSGAASFTSSLTGLSEETLYYVRAYATNSDGTGYGSVKTFATLMDEPPTMVPPGYALDFDGTDDYVSILNNESNFDFTTAMTIEAWIKVDAFDKEWQAIVTKGDGSWRLHRHSGTNHISFGTSGLSNVDLEGSTDVNNGQWHHVACVFDGSTKYIYVDGTSDASVSATGSIANNDYLVNIAENGENTGRYFNGLIDEVRIWNIARTQTEINDNKNNVLTGNESGLVAYYKFDQTSGSYLYDHTENGNQGALQNMDNSDWVPSGWLTDNITWTGDSDNDWAKPGNWEGATGPPVSGKNAVIPVTANNPRLESSAEIDGLYISDGASLTIGENGSLTVDGILSNASGSGGLVIESTATGTGSLIHSTENVPATVQRYIGAAGWENWQDGWHFVSSPVENQGINAGEGWVTSGVDNDFDFYAWSEPNSLWVNFENNSQPPYFTEVNGSGSFVPGIGYLAAYQQTGTKLFKGYLNADDILISGMNITAAEEVKSWHLLGNPFSCALNWNSWEKTGTGTTLQLWSESLSDYSPLPEGESAIVPAMNGFMAEVLQDNASITIPTGARTHSDQSWYKSAGDNTLKLTVWANDKSSGKECFIRFNNQSTEGFDPEYDGHYLRGYGPVFYSLAGSEQLSVNTLPISTGTTEVPLIFEKNGLHDFSVYAEGLENFPGGVRLVDLKTGISRSLNQNPDYSFTASDGDDPERFLLKFSPVGITEIQENELLEIFAYGKSITIINPDNLSGTIKLSDITGREVMQQTLKGESVLRLETNLVTGIYIVNVLTGRGIEKEKIIIK
ncbi:MAG TPA: T9SS type A sorting domain-containing protein [Bacteroidales bacterium]|nr:T9SS type A sorting domain-containing protein [Bacteroidales bacterium]